MLTAGDFPAYFEAVHGVPPFGWQVRLLSRTLDEGWHGAISVPTGCGKTAVLDVAVYALAAQAHLAAAERRAPRRIALVVDRRIVVDDAHTRAMRIADALAAPTNPTLRRVADALLSLGGERPLDVAALRGGIYREDRWARTPLQPVLLCSTVDQVGSRLLHRGYGLSSRVWPIHAGLLGHDTLIVLDEAHCSQPFLQTLDRVAELRAHALSPVPGPWAFVPMTATPRAGGSLFRLGEQERSEAPIARRLGASKVARLAVAREKGDAGLVAAALQALLDPQAAFLRAGSVTLVVLNRVRPARQLYDILRASDGTAEEADVLLLTGRARPVERDALLAQYLPRLRTGRVRTTGGRPLVVVATQCIEVGADIDVDALITEVAPLDSLRQRFGRLDRLGERGRTDAVVICRKELTGDINAAKLPRNVDPVYGAVLTETWWWLQRANDGGPVDFGIDAMDRRLATDSAAASLGAKPASAPFLLSSYCDLWAQTGPEPAVAPEPAVFLHGLGSAPADVGIVWRADLDPARPDTWADIVAAAPPVQGEVLPLPLHAARAWLQGGDADPGADQEGDQPPAEEDATQRAARPALDWRGGSDSRLVGPDELRPGSTLVVPCAWGGVDAMGWTGRPGAPATDVMEAALRAARRPPVLRLHPQRSLASDSAAALPGWLAQASREDEQGLPAERELRSEIAVLLADWPDEQIAPALQPTVKALRDAGRRLRVQAHPSGTGLVVSGWQRLGPEARDFSDEDDASSLATVGALSLDAHLRDVAGHAERHARGAGLPDELIDVLRRAGHLHDLGKADPRFHAWLQGGDWSRVNPGQPLAKSDRVRIGRASERARQLAGYPKGGRHELLSVRLAESVAGVLPEEPHARDLVLHLVASHHGHCRPWAPVVVDARPLEVSYRHEGVLLQARSDTELHRIDSGVADRFWRLIRRYGWWGLAFLEACLRLADHRASERPGIPDTGEEA